MRPVGDAVRATPYEATSARGLVGRGAADAVSEAEVKRVGWRHDCRQFAAVKKGASSPLVRALLLDGRCPF